MSDRIQSRRANVILGCLVLSAAVLILYASRGTNFWYDEWDFVQHEYGGGLRSLLLPHNEHLSLVPIVVYKLLFAVVGLNHYTWYRVAGVAFDMACCVLLYLFASRRVGRLPAILATALIAFLGPAWEDLLWPFQIGFMGSIAGGLAAWLLLDREDWTGDVAAASAVGFSVASSGVGLAVLAGVAVELTCQKQWRRLWIIVIPLALYVLWYFSYGNDHVTVQSVVDAPGFSADMAATGVGGLFGRALEWGRPLAAVAVALGLRRLVTAGLSVVTPRLIGLIAAAAAFWLLTGISRSTIETPDQNRYVFVSAILIVAIAVELAPRRRATTALLAVMGVVVSLCVLNEITALYAPSNFLRGTDAKVSAELGAMQLARAHVPSDYTPDPQQAPQVIAGPYFAATSAIGSSPGDTPARLATADAASRVAADAVLIALEAPGPRAVAAPPSQVGATGPKPLAVSGGGLAESGSCVLLTPAGGQATADLSLPPGGTYVSDAGASVATLALRRFGDGYQALTTSVAANSSASLPISTDAANAPWLLQVTTASRVTLCG